MFGTGVVVSTVPCPFEEKLAIYLLVSKAHERYIFMWLN